MREPKFRGFSKITNKWHYGHGWFEVDYAEDFLKEKGINQEAVLHTDGYPVECELSSMGQYTGLKDKNGKDIYAGDVIEREYHVSFYISFEEGSFVAVPINQVQRFNWEHPPLSRFDIGLWEVSGNIYENPELLEKDQHHD